MSKLKITRQTKKELEQTIMSFAEETGIPHSEARQEMRGFMKGASSMFVVDALSSDELGHVKNNDVLAQLKEVGLNRWSDAKTAFYKNRQQGLK